MSTIESTIALHDGVSPALQKMTAAGGEMVAKMEQAGRAATSFEASAEKIAARPVTAMHQVSAAAATSTTEIEKMVPASTAASSALGGLGAKATSVFSSIKASLMSLVSMFAGMFAIGSLVSTMQRAMDAAAGMGQAELKLNVIMRQRMGANADMVNSIKQLIGAQQEVGVVSRQAQTAGAQQLATFLKERDSLAALIPAMNNLAAQQHGSKATAEDMVNISNMMGRALQGNVGALTRCGISFSDAQANILKFGSESERAAVMAEVITQNVGKMNEEMGKTAGGQAVQKMNAVNDALANVGKRINGAMNHLKVASGDIQIGAIAVMGSIIIGAVNAFTALANEATAAYNAVKPLAEEVGQFMRDNWSGIEPIIIGIVAALVAYNVVAGISAAVATEGSIAHGIYAAATTLASIATGELSASTAILNAVMSMNPIMLVVMAVIILITIFYLAVAAVNHFAGTNISATGLIFGAYAWLWTNIINMIKMVANVFIAFANFLGSVFQDPLGAAYNLFVDIWDAIVDYVRGAIESVIDMIMKIPGIDKVLSGRPSLPDLHAERKEITNAAFHINPFEYGNATYNAEQAYDVGASLPDNIEKMFHPDDPGGGNNGDGDNNPAGDGAGDAADNAGRAADNAGKIADHTGKIADDTARIADKIDMTDEEIKELRAMALQSTMNSWQDSHNIEIHIDQQNMVSGGQDIDGMNSDLIDSLREAMSTHGERTAMT